MTPALAIYDPSPIAQLDIAPTLILPEDYFDALQDQIAEAFLLAEMAFEEAREASEPTVYTDAAEKFLCECRVSQPVLRAILTDRAETLALWDIVMAGAAFGMAPAHVDLDEYGQPIVWHKGDGWAAPVPSPLLAHVNARGPVDQDGNPVPIDGPCIIIPHEFWDTLRETIRTDPEATEERKRYYQPEKGQSYAWNLTCPKRNLFYPLTLFVQGKQKLSARAALSLAEHYNLRFDLVTCGPNGARTQMLGAEKPKAYPPLRLVETEAEDMDLNEQQFEAMLDLGSDVKAVERGVEQMVVALRAMSGPAGAHLSEDEKRTIMQLAADCGESMLADELPKVSAVSAIIDRKLEEIAKQNHRSGFTLVD